MASPAQPPTAVPPLTARSVLLSVLLGSHPPRLPVRALVRVGQLLGVSEGTIRVALSRMTAEGELASEAGWYRLTGRLADRQAALDRGRRPPVRAWRQTWELAVWSDELGAGERASLADACAGAGLAPAREGVWMRPDNLNRAWPESCAGALRVVGRIDGDQVALAARLWDLAGWALEGGQLAAAMDARPDPAGRFALAAAIARHLRTDPLLPAVLLPPAWPGERLRRLYDGYEDELAKLIREALTG